MVKLAKDVVGANELGNVLGIDPMEAGELTVKEAYHHLTVDVDELVEVSGGGTTKETVMRVANKLKSYL